MRILNGRRRYSRPAPRLLAACLMIAGCSPNVPAEALQRTADGCAARLASAVTGTGEVALSALCPEARHICVVREYVSFADLFEGRASREARIFAREQSRCPLADVRGADSAAVIIAVPARGCPSIVNTRRHFSERPAQVDQSCWSASETTLQGGALSFSLSSGGRDIAAGGATGHYLISRDDVGALHTVRIGGAEIGGLVQCGASAVAYLSHADRTRSKLFHLDPRTGRRRVLFESAFAQPRSCSPDGRFVVFDSTRCQGVDQCFDDPDLPTTSAIRDLESGRTVELPYAVLRHRWDADGRRLIVGDSNCPRPYRLAQPAGVSFRIERDCGLPHPVTGEATPQGGIADPTLAAPAAIARDPGAERARELVERIRSQWPRLTIISCSPLSCLVEGEIGVNALGREL